MKLKIKAFGITKEIIGSRELIVDVNIHTVAQLRTVLINQYPALTKLNSLFVAVNSQYAAEEQTLQETDEIALIPPVSGG